MKGKLIQTLILILLIGLNLTLLVLYLVELRRTRLVTQEAVDRVVALYEAEQVEIHTEIPQTVKRREAIALRAADLDGMVVRFLGDAEYSRTYIYGNKIQYRSGTAVLMADWGAHNINYRDSAYEENVESSGSDGELTEAEREMLMAAGRRFAEKWLGEDIMMMSSSGVGQVLTMTFCQLQEGELMYFNRVSVTLVPGGVRLAEIQYWDVDSGETKIESKPIDELLYQMLPQVSADMKRLQVESDSVEEMLDGYEIISYTRDTAIAYPNLTIVLGSGRYYHLRYTG